VVDPDSGTKNAGGNGKAQGLASNIGPSEPKDIKKFVPALIMLRSAQRADEAEDPIFLGMGIPHRESVPQASNMGDIELSFPLEDLFDILFHTHSTIA
jgi:hypothetical protein